MAAWWSATWKQTRPFLGEGGGAVDVVVGVLVQGRVGGVDPGALGADAAEIRTAASNPVVDSVLSQGDEREFSFSAGSNREWGIARQ